jgi:hypothetical protein
MVEENVTGHEAVLVSAFIKPSDDIDAEVSLVVTGFVQILLSCRFRASSTQSDITRLNYADVETRRCVTITPLFDR